MTNTRTLAAVAAGLLLLAPAAAQEKPSFAGHWVLVTPARSAGQEQWVTQDATTLTTSHEPGHKMVYRLDGSESRNVLTSHGSDIVTRSTARWTGSRLTITSETTYPGGRTRQSTELWSLDSEGRLVITFTEGAPGAQPTSTTIVFKKSAA